MLMLTVPAAAWAQSPASSSLTDDQLWEFGVWGGESFGKTIGQAFGETQITMAGFHAGRVIHESSASRGHKRTLEYTVELQPLLLVTRPQSVYGGGFSPIGLKWNFAPRGRGRYRPYLEVNGGAMFTQKNVPPGNTEDFNFTCSGGSGVMIGLGSNRALSVGLRFWHLSNASLGNSNPAFNTVQFVIGYHWLTARHRSRQQISSAPGDTQAKE
jgi:hypothetical protein